MGNQGFDFYHKRHSVNLDTPEIHSSFTTERLLSDSRIMRGVVRKVRRLMEENDGFYDLIEKAEGPRDWYFYPDDLRQQILNHGSNYFAICFHEKTGESETILEEPEDSKFSLLYAVSGALQEVFSDERTPSSLIPSDNSEEKKITPYEIGDLDVPWRGYLILAKPKELKRIFTQKQFLKPIRDAENYARQQIEGKRLAPYQSEMYTFTHSEWERVDTFVGRFMRIWWPEDAYKTKIVESLKNQGYRVLLIENAKVLQEL
jgi:hypothetical protein